MAPPVAHPSSSSSNRARDPPKTKPEPRSPVAETQFRPIDGPLPHGENQSPSSSPKTSKGTSTVKTGTSLILPATPTAAVLAPPSRPSPGSSKPGSPSHSPSFSTSPLPSPPKESSPTRGGKKSPSKHQTSYSLSATTAAQRSFSPAAISPSHALFPDLSTPKAGISWGPLLGLGIGSGGSKPPSNPSTSNPQSPSSGSPGLERSSSLKDRTIRHKVKPPSVSGKRLKDIAVSQGIDISQRGASPSSARRLSGGESDSPTSSRGTVSLDLDRKSVSDSLKPVMPARPSPSFFPWAPWAPWTTETPATQSTSRNTLEADLAKAQRDDNANNWSQHPPQPTTEEAVEAAQRAARSTSSSKKGSIDWGNWNNWNQFDWDSWMKAMPGGAATGTEKGKVNNQDPGKSSGTGFPDLDLDFTLPNMDLMSIIAGKSASKDKGKEKIGSGFHPAYEFPSRPSPPPRPKSSPLPYSFVEGAEKGYFEPDDLDDLVLDLPPAPSDPKTDDPSSMPQKDIQGKMGRPEPERRPRSAPLPHGAGLVGPSRRPSLESDGQPAPLGGTGSFFSSLFSTKNNPSLAERAKKELAGTSTSAKERMMDDTDLEVQEKAFGILKDVYRTPKHPLIFCHGLFGFDTLGPASIPPLQISYWRGVREALEERGCEVMVGRVPASANIETRAKVLCELIESNFPGREVNLLGHSMGGVDGRYLISTLKPKTFKIKSLTTIASPHRGSTFADFFVEEMVGKENMPSFLNFLSTLQVPGGGQAFEALTTSAMARFNAENPDSPDVSYFSYGAEFTSSWSNPFRVPWGVIMEREGANDGMVSVESSKWGEYKGTLHDVNHLDLVGWVGRVRFAWGDWSGKKIRFKPISFYLSIAEMLADKGF